jgi:hypothetical protein
MTSSEHGDGMSGIVFFRTEHLDDVVEFYTGTVGAAVWLEQPDCTILEHDGFRVGFCARDATDDCGVVTFVYDDRDAVDEMYEAVGDAARESPHENATYDIYQFFADDPDGRTVEFQTFLHPV